MVLVVLFLSIDLWWHNFEVPFRIIAWWETIAFSAVMSWQLLNHFNTLINSISAYLCGYLHNYSNTCNYVCCHMELTASWFMSCKIAIFQNKRKNLLKAVRKALFLFHKYKVQSVNSYLKQKVYWNSMRLFVEGFSCNLKKSEKNKHDFNFRLILLF